VTPGLASRLQRGSFGVTSAEDERGGQSPIDRADARPICVSQTTRNPYSSSSQGRDSTIRYEDRSSFHLDRRTSRRMVHERIEIPRARQDHLRCKRSAAPAKR
jgi:hypothetical protein